MWTYQLFLNTCFEYSFHITECLAVYSIAVVVLCHWFSGRLCSSDPLCVLFVGIDMQDSVGRSVHLWSKTYTPCSHCTECLQHHVFFTVSLYSRHSYISDMCYLVNQCFCFTQRLFTATNTSHQMTSKSRKHLYQLSPAPALTVVLWLWATVFIYLIFTLHSANQMTVLINLAHQLFSLAPIGLILGAVPAIIFHCALRSPSAGKWLPWWLLLSRPVVKWHLCNDQGLAELRLLSGSLPISRILLLSQSASLCANLFSCRWHG